MSRAAEFDPSAHQFGATTRIRTASRRQPEMTTAAALGPKEQLGGWWFRNIERLAVYLLCAAALTASIGIFGSEDWFSSFFYGTFLIAGAGGLYCLPGMLVWLTIMSVVPPHWSTGVRRAIAVGTGPII